MKVEVAKVFMNGQSQAVRLPKAFRVDTDEVFIMRENGRIVLVPKPKMTWDEYFQSAENFPDFDVERRTIAKPTDRELWK